MKIAVLVICLLFGVCFVCGTREEFESFKKQYNKGYETKFENERRFRIFEENLKIAAAKNTPETKATWGVTKFFDLTPAEFKATYLMKELTRPNTPSVPVWEQTHSKEISVPNSFDWSSKGVVSPVKDQGQCGSCWAFSATETIESVYAIAGHQVPVLSPQQIVDCDDNDDGCDGGYPYEAFAYVISAGGLDTLASYPYTAQDGNCAFNPKTVGGSISNWEYVTWIEDESAMQSYVYATSPISVCVDAETWQYYTGGVITSADNCGDSLDHAVVATGWLQANGTTAWNVRNSWGADWGEKGYIWLAFDDDVCGVADLVTAPIA